MNGSFGLGIIEEVHPQELWVIALENSGVKTSLESVGTLWKYPDNLDLIVVELVDVLPVRPVIELDRQKSRNLRSGRQVIFRLLNDDILLMFLSNLKK